MDNQFFPEGWQPESGGQGDKYLKIKDEVRVRIIQPPLIYFQAWTEQDGKPKPVRSAQPFPEGSGPWKEAPRMVLGLFCYDLDADRVVFWEVTQVSIQRELFNLNADKDFGDPRNYDLKISKTGSGKETKYSLRPLAVKPIADHIMQAWNAEHDKIDVEGYYTGKPLWKE